MQIEIISSDKHAVELRVSNVTVAELLRVYLYESGAEFAAWRREHPSKPVVFKITAKDKPVKKVVSDAVESIKKDCAHLLNSVKK